MPVRGNALFLTRALKGVLLPRTPRFRRIPFGPAAGVTMMIDFAHQSRHFFGFYEREIQSHLRRLVGPGSRCFDVGGDVGFYTLALARLSGERVVVFDPSPISIGTMRANFARNQYAITIVEAAVGAGDGSGRTTIDAAARIHFVPDFIKMDIEGAEVDALSGATDVLAGRRPHLIIEVHGRAEESACEKILNAYGYTPIRVAPGRWLPEERPAAYNGWLVCEGRRP